MSPSADQTHVAITGLTTQEAEARLGQFGPNEPAAAQHHSILFDLLHGFMNPLVLILVIAAIASAFLGDKVDAGIIGVIVLLSAAIDFSSDLSFSTRRRTTARHRLPLRQPSCATGSGKKFGGVTWCRETSSAFPPEIWFPRTRAS